jgi:hypothetical protein
MAVLFMSVWVAALDDATLTCSNVRVGLRLVKHVPTHKQPVKSVPSASAATKFELVIGQQSGASSEDMRTAD